MDLHKINRVLDKYIVNKYTYIGSPTDSSLEYLKNKYGKPLFINFNDTTSCDNAVGSVFCKNPVIISLNNKNADNLIELLNKIGPADHKYIIRVPKSFEFKKFINSIKFDHIDIYNYHNNNNNNNNINSEDGYFIVSDI